MKKNLLIPQILMFSILYMNAYDSFDQYKKQVSKEVTHENGFYIGIDHRIGKADTNLFHIKGINQPISEFVNTDMRETRISIGLKGGKLLASAKKGSMNLEGSSAGFLLGKGVESTSIGGEFKITNPNISIASIQPYLSGHFSIGFYDDKDNVNNISTSITPINLIMQSDEEIAKGNHKGVALMTNDTHYTEMATGVGVIASITDAMHINIGYEMSSRLYSLEYSLTGNLGDTYSYQTTTHILHNLTAGITYRF